MSLELYANLVAHRGLSAPGQEAAYELVSVSSGFVKPGELYNS